MPTYLELIASHLPAKPWKGHLGERFVGLVGGMFGNFMAEGSSLAVQAFWLIAGQASDVLSYQGGDRGGLRKYIAETFDEYRSRLEGALALWESGPAARLASELDAAGYEDAQVHSPLDWNRGRPNWWSQFWIFLPFESHADGTPVHRCGDGTLCGSGALAGLGTPFGPGRRAGSTQAIAGQHTAGITAAPELIEELRFIATKFKSGEEICRQIIVEIDAPVCGSGILCDDGHLCGGTVGLIGTGVNET